MSAKATLAPLKGHISVDLDPFSRQWVLSHDLSHEIFDLGAYRGVALVYDDADGSAVVACEPFEEGGEHRFVIVEDVLVYSVYLDQELRPLILERGSDQPLFIEDLRCRHDLVDLTLPRPHNGTAASWELADFDRRQWAGLSWRWSLHSLYNMCNLRAHQGHRWLWVAKNIVRWERYMQNCFPEAPGEAIQKAQPRSAPAPEVERSPICLPWPSCTSYAVLALLVRFFGNSAPQSGALTCEQARVVARGVFVNLLQLCSGEAFALQLLLSEQAHVRWPRPSCGANAIQVEVGARLMVDMSNLDFATLDDPRDPCAVWFATFVAEGGPVQPLVALFEGVAQWATRKTSRKLGLLGQLCVGVARRLESALSDFKCSVAMPPLDGCVVERRAFDPHHTSLANVSNELFRHWQAQQERFEVRPTMVSMASDKSRVLGQSLLSSLFVLPDNTATWAFPVVELVEARGEGPKPAMPSSYRQEWVSDRASSDLDR